MESFGARLKREREKKGVKLDDISLSTKIGTRFLRALEEEHFDQLPGGIFNRGFVRAYARHLGLDEDQAVADYLAASGEASPIKPVEPQIAVAPEAEPEEPDNGVAQIPWGVLAGALLVIAFGFAIWGFNSREKQRETQAAVAPASRQETVVPTPVAASSTPALAQGREATAGTSRTAAAAASMPSSTAATPAAESRTPAPGEFVVLIKAQDDSWLSITADGQRIMEDTLIAGSEKVIHAQKFIAIRAGNVGALEFFFNGKKLPSQGDAGEVKTLTFSAGGLEPPKPVPPAASDTTPQPQ